MLLLPIIYWFDVLVPLISRLSLLGYEDVVAFLAACAHTRRLVVDPSLRDLPFNSLLPGQLCFVVSGFELYYVDFRLFRPVCALV